MEGEIIKLSNIMPVDLALKRELEYRKKMEASNNQHQMDLKPLVLPQAPVSESQTMVDRKRKEQASYAQCSRTLLPSARFICVVCNTAFTDVLNLKMHGETLLHKAKVFQSRKRGGNVSNPFLCELCDNLCSSGLVMQFHVTGLKHGAYLREVEAAKRARIYGNLGFS